MNLDITPEVLVSQLNLGNTEAILNQTKLAIDSTNEFKTFAKHIISLNDQLKHMNAYIGLSNSKPYLKIKCENTESIEIVQEFEEHIKHWSDKYNINLEKVPHKNVYYILGK